MKTNATLEFDQCTPHKKKKKTSNLLYNFRNSQCNVALIRQIGISGC